MTASDRGQGDRGSVTVEFAVALPVVTLVLVSLVAGVVLADRAGRLQDTAGAAARALGRGDDGAAATAVSSGAPGRPSVSAARTASCASISGRPLPGRSPSCRSGRPAVRAEGGR